jgi:Lanthionine synthetase C-like protein
VIRWNDDSDIISGSAGIGLTLLSLGQELRRPELINLAVQAGTDLLGRSVPTAHDRYWLHEIGAEKQYPNFSHGTAGVAYFLLKLYERTGEKRFLDIRSFTHRNAVATPRPRKRGALQGFATFRLSMHRRHHLRGIPFPGDFQLAESLICLLQIRLSQLHR